MLISCGLFYFKSYIFRTVSIDLFLLEIPAFFIIILFNISSFAKRFKIAVPSNRRILLIIFILINFLLNEGAWQLLKNYDM